MWTMNREVLEAFLTTEILIHPNQCLTFMKKQTNFLYDEFDEIEVNNIIHFYKNISKNTQKFKKRFKQ